MFSETPEAFHINLNWGTEAGE